MYINKGTFNVLMILLIVVEKVSKSKQNYFGELILKLICKFLFK